MRSVTYKSRLGYRCSARRSCALSCAEKTAGSCVTSGVKTFWRTLTQSSSFVNLKFVSQVTNVWLFFFYIRLVRQWGRDKDYIEIAVQHNISCPGKVQNGLENHSSWSRSLSRCNSSCSVKSLTQYTVNQYSWSPFPVPF